MQATSPIILYNKISFLNSDKMEVFPCEKKLSGDECPLKVIKFQLAISSRLALAHEKPDGGF